MNSYTDAYGRIITPINPQPGDPIPVLGEPIFHADVDHQMNVMAEGGINWFVMKDYHGSPLFLAFHFEEGVTLDALDAAQRLKRQFDADGDLRHRMMESAIADGTAYHQLDPEVSLDLSGKAGA